MRVAWVALGALSAIVATGAAVRLTGSGLGCPTWPKCYGNVYPPLNSHAVIEFTNRRADLPALRRGGPRLGRSPCAAGPTGGTSCGSAALLPLGVVGQAVLGGFTVKGALDYGWVMGHFALSMLILVAAVVLVWRAGHESEQLAASTPTDRTVVRMSVPSRSSAP